MCLDSIHQMLATALIVVHLIFKSISQHVPLGLVNLVKLQSNIQSPRKSMTTDTSPLHGFPNTFCSHPAKRWFSLRTKCKHGKSSRQKSLIKKSHSSIYWQVNWSKNPTRLPFYKMSRVNYLLVYWPLLKLVMQLTCKLTKSTKQEPKLWYLKILICLIWSEVEMFSMQLHWSLLTSMSKVPNAIVFLKSIFYSCIFAPIGLFLFFFYSLHVNKMPRNIHLCGSAFRLSTSGHL